MCFSGFRGAQNVKDSQKSEANFSYIINTLKIQIKSVSYFNKKIIKKMSSLCCCEIICFTVAYIYENHAILSYQHFYIL